MEGVKQMITDLDVIAIIIALSGSMLVMFLFYKQNVAQQKEIRRLRNELRKLLKV